MININEIKVFLEVVNTGSITGASKNLFISQPAISQHIKNMEEKLNVKLFERIQGGNILKLTEEGFVIYKELESLSRVFDETIDRITNLQKNIESLLKIGASKTIGDYLLPKIMVDFLKAHNVNFSVDIQNTSDVVEEVLDEEISVGFVEIPFFHKSLESEKFYMDEMNLISSPGFPLPSKIEIEDLNSLPLILREKGSGTRKLIEYKFESLGITPNVIITLSSNEAIKYMIKSGIGVGFLSKLIYEDDEKNGSIIVLNIENLKIERNFFMIRKKERIMSNLEREFLDFVRKWGEEDVS
ncbi:LysR family transcriptional regulator [Athalassotoga saccharophila]|uniref:LysR family transcriptional regulator n=1 Tax=Athalassotoga saccharophila TaxID=1441386 RepID=UPI0013799C5B|nr:LysR family transcriptional regulator [Athalassotoga saccharophila]BBJ28508.1 HTH-type transcriptional activator CmpR [Athalassotoga saccharophila]